VAYITTGAAPASPGGGAWHSVVITYLIKLVLAGAPLPDGADAVVQIENTEQLPQGPDGQRRVRIVKVRMCMHAALLSKTITFHSGPTLHLKTCT
jgi:hypothetical protein